MPIYTVPAGGIESDNTDPLYGTPWQGRSYQYDNETGQISFPTGSLNTVPPPWIPEPYGYPFVNSPDSGGGGEGEGEGGGEGGGHYTFDFSGLPPATYLRSPTDEEMYFMSRFGGAGYDNWARDVTGEAYNDLPDIYRSILAEAFANPDTSMFAYPEDTLARLSGLGDIVRGYYDEITPGVYEDWQQNQRPFIEEQFAGPGYWGTPRAQAVSDSRGDLQRQLGMQEAGAYANAKTQGTLLDTQARLGIDAAKMNYLAQNAGLWNQNLASGLSGIENTRAATLASLLGQAPTMAGAVAGMSRQFVEPVMNPEYIAAVNLATGMLGIPAFATAGWTTPPDTGWSNLLGSLGSSVGSALARSIPGLFNPSDPTGSTWTPQTVDLNDFNYFAGGNNGYSGTYPGYVAPTDYSGGVNTYNPYNVLPSGGSGGYSGSNNPYNYSSYTPASNNDFNYNIANDDWWGSQNYGGDY